VSTDVAVQGDASGFYRLASPLLARTVRRAIAGDLAQLQGVLEATTAPSAT
jgi:hypothetical protein